MTNLPSLPNATLYDVFKAYRDIAVPLQQLSEVLMRKPGPISVVDRELIAAYTSALNGCDFCAGVHTALTEKMGTAKGFVADALNDLDTAGASDKMKPLLAYVRKLTLTPHQITRADADAVYEAGWDEAALVYATMICGEFNLMNRLLEGLGIEASRKNIEDSVEFLAAHGYEGVLKHL